MRYLCAISLALASWAAAVSATAADVKVLTAGAFKPVVMALAPEFEKRTGHKLKIENDTSGALMRRIADGETFDLVVLTPAGIEQLTNSGKVIAGSSLRLARVAIGVAVKRGAPTPDISSVAAFRQALLAAQNVAYIDPAAGGSSGVYLSQLFEKMGIASQIRSKAVLVSGGLVAQHIVSGEADLAVHQISEILAVPGVTLVGPIPAEIQNYTVYAGAVGTTARNVPAAQTFLALLGSASAQEVLKKKGMEAP